MAEEYDDVNIEDEDDEFNEDDIDYDEEEELEYEQEGIDLDVGFDVADIDMNKYVAPVKNDYNDVMRRAEGVNDINHQTDPFMTKYEYTRIRGVRLQQLASGCPPYVVVPPHVSSIEEIFELEFMQKKLPYIIKRPLPNGEFEYWKFKNLMYLPAMVSEGKPKVYL